MGVSKTGFIFTLAVTKKKYPPIELPPPTKLVQIGKSGYSKPLCIAVALHLQKVECRKLRVQQGVSKSLSISTFSSTLSIVSANLMKVDEALAEVSTLPA